MTILILFAAMMMQQPIDVPPIHARKLVGFLPEHNQGQTCEVEGIQGITRVVEDRGWQAYSCEIYTTVCRDKSRILLTAEDGSKHCIKFDPAATYRLGDAVELERRKK